MAEAYLEPLPNHPGITSLLLNRPKAKNAISMNLLKVRSIHILPQLSPASSYCAVQEFQECLDKVQFDKRYVHVPRAPVLMIST